MSIKQPAVGFLGVRVIRAATIRGINSKRRIFAPTVIREPAKIPITTQMEVDAVLFVNHFPRKRAQTGMKEPAKTLITTQMEVDAVLFVNHCQKSHRVAIFAERTVRTTPIFIAEMVTNELQITPT